MAVGLADNRGASANGPYTCWTRSRMSAEECRRAMSTHHADHLYPTGLHRGDPVDPDIDLHDPDQRSELAAHPWTLAVIGAGGVVGASARYGLELLWPPPDPTDVPWATFAANVTGCLVLGVVMVAVTEAGQRHPLWRPFLGVGIVGGYTTFSTYAVQVQQGIQAEASGLAVGYLFGTLAAALVAVTAGTMAARTLLRGLGRHRPPPPFAGSPAQRDTQDEDGTNR
jgi:CrcB protein